MHGDALMKVLVFEKMPVVLTADVAEMGMRIESVLIPIGISNLLTPMMSRSF